MNLVLMLTVSSMSHRPPRPYDVPSPPSRVISTTLNVPPPSRPYPGRSAPSFTASHLNPPTAATRSSK